MNTTQRDRMARLDTRAATPLPPPRGPGRPSQKELDERPPQPAQVVIITVPVEALICPCCGRGMTPRVIDTRGNKRTVFCSLCAGRFLITYDEGKPSFVRRL